MRRELLLTHLLEQLMFEIRRKKCQIHQKKQHVIKYVRRIRPEHVAISST